MKTNLFINMIKKGPSKISNQSKSIKMWHPALPRGDPATF